MSIPSRLSESNFRRFEPSFALALKAFPEVITVSLPPLSPRTVAARLRDAIISLREFKWPNNLDTNDLSALKVFEIENVVYLGGKPPSTNKPIVATCKLQQGPNNNTWTHEELVAVCLLISHQRVASGLVVPLVDPAVCQDLESRFNVSLVAQNNGSTLIL